MSGTRIAFESTYKSGLASAEYRFTVRVDAYSNLSVRDITTPYGLIMDSMTNLPQSVMADITNAMTQMETILAITTPVNGTLSFVSEASKDVVFSVAMASTTYRVYLNPSDFIAARVSSKSTTGFTVQTASTFTGTVGYDVFI